MYNNKHVYVFFLVAMIVCIFVFNPGFAQAQSLNSDVSKYIDTLLYIWFGGDSSSYENTLAQLNRTLASLGKKQKDPSAQQSCIVGQMFVALLEYNLTNYDSLRSSVAIDSMYVYRADTLYALMNNAIPQTISQYINQNSAFADYDYLIIGNYFLQKGEYIKARQWYLEGLKKSITLRQSFDILLGVTDAIEKGDDALYAKTKGGRTTHYLCLLPYLRPQDIFYYLKNDIPLKSSYSLKVLSSHKLSFQDAKEYLQQDQFPLTKSSTTHCTMADIIHCFTVIMALSGNEPNMSSSVNIDYLPQQLHATASYLIENNIISLYLDGRIPVYSTITGVHFQKMYNAYIKKFGKPTVSTNIQKMPMYTLYANVESYNLLLIYDVNPVAPIITLPKNPQYSKICTYYPILYYPYYY